MSRSLFPAVSCLRALLLLPLSGLVACHRSGFPEVAPGFHEFAYVANAGAGTVSVLDLVYLRADRTLKVGERPVALAVNTLRHEVYAVNQGGAGSLSVIGSANNQVEATIAVRRGASSIAAAADGERAYVADAGANAVSVVDLAARRELLAVPVPESPTELRLSPDARSLVVVSRAAGMVYVYAVAPTVPGSRQPLQLRASFPGCAQANSPVMLPDSSKVFVACAGSHGVMAVSLAAAPESWAAKSNPSLLTDHLLTLLEVGTDPEHLAMKPDGGEIFVSNTAANSISEISTQTNEVGGTYTIAERPGDAVVSADNSTLWVSNQAADSLGIYSIDDGRLVGGVRTGAGPDALALSADEHLLLAANTRSGDVSVIRTRGTGAPALFTMLPAGSGPVAVVTHAFTEPR